MGKISVAHTVMIIAIHRKHVSLSHALRMKRFVQLCTEKRLVLTS